MSLRILCLWTSLSILCLSEGAAASSDLQVRPAPVGCYHLRLGAWSGPVGNFYLPPAVFRLDSTAVQAVPVKAYRVEPDIYTGRHEPGPLWYARGPDTLHVVWSTGLTGVAMDLVEMGDTLKGNVHMFTDVAGPPPDPSVSVVAVRVSCKAMGAAGS